MPAFGWAFLFYGNHMELSGDELFNKAKEMLVEGKDLDKAFHSFNLLFNSTLKENKNNDSLLFHLGAVCMKQGYNALSILLFKESMKYRENFIEAVNNIGYVYKKEQMQDKALLYFEKAKELADHYPDHVSNKDKADYLTNIGSMYIANGTPQKALEYFDEALKLDEDVPLTKWNRSLANLELGNYAEGFPEYDFGERQERVKKRNYAVKDLPIWDGIPDKNKVISVYGEQGIGDEIMFASMIPDLMQDCKVVIDGHPRLADLFRNSFNIPVYGTRKAEKITWPEHQKVDAIIGMGSLGQYYRKKKEDFPGTPYINAEPKRAEKYRAKFEEMGPKPKIGISWKGGSLETGRSDRCMSLDTWKPIFELYPEVDFISLQYDKNIGARVTKFEEENKINLNHWQYALDDYDETAGLISNLDLIISVPQSIVHLAGAMGVPTWQLVPFKALWQCGPYGEDAPWYSSVRNFWQDEQYRPFETPWDQVINKVKEELCNLLQKSTAV